MWLLAAFVSFLVVGLQIRAEDKDVPLAWCNTIECTMLFFPARYDSTVDNTKKFHYLYVPGEDLLNAADSDVDKLIQTHYKKLEHDSYTSPIFHNSSSYPRFSYAYIPSIGRFQDIILDDGSSSPANLVDYITKHSPYSIYSFDADQEGCVDKYGYPTKQIYNLTACMSIFKVGKDANDLEYYSGPLTWNRIQFRKEDLLLRWILSNKSFAAAGFPNDDRNHLNMESFLTCRHIAKGSVAPPSVCYSSYNIFQYTSVCCCYEKSCHELDTRGKTNMTRCAVGSYSSASLVATIATHDYAEFVAQSINQYCQMSYIATKKKDDKVAEIKVTLNATSLATNNSHSKEEILRKNNVVCFLDQLICPGDFNETGKEDHQMAATCLCPSSEECIRQAAKSYQNLNTYFGRHNEENFCEHKTFYNGFFKLNKCSTYYDPRKGKAVGLSDNNNFYVVNTIGSFVVGNDSQTHHLLKDKPFRLFALSGSIFEDVVTMCQPEEAVYQADEVGFEKKRLLYHATCKSCDSDEGVLGDWKKCDTEIKNILKNITEKNLGYVPLCPYVLNKGKIQNYIPRTGDLEVDIQKLNESVVMEMSISTGYCFLQYVSPDTSSDLNGNGFIVRNATLSDIKDLQCPGEGGNCTVDMPTGRLCCLPTFQTNDNKYKDNILNIFKVFVEGLSVANDSENIAELVAKPGTCNIAISADSTSTEVDECGIENGCFDEYLFTTDKNQNAGGCSSTAVLSTQLGSRDYRFQIHAGFVCQIATTGTGKPYKDECVLVDNGIETIDSSVPFRWPSYTEGDRLRSTKIVCCCKDEECKFDVTRFQLYYDNFLDAENDKIDKWLRDLNVPK